MVGLSRANHLFSRLFVAAAVALLVCCCCYCSVVSCAMVPSKTPTPSVGRPSVPSGTEDRSKHHQLSHHAERESNSQFSSRIAIDKNQHLTETKESEVSEYSQRIPHKDGVSTRDNVLHQDDGGVLPGEVGDRPGRERVIRAAEPGLTDGVEVAEPGFLVKTVQSFKNVEGSGSAALPDSRNDDDRTDSMRVTPSADAQPTSTDGINCPECVKKKQSVEKLPPEKLREMRLEQIKMRILSKLKLEQAPNVSASSVDIPEPLARGQMVGDLNEVLSVDDQDTSEFPDDDDRWEEEELENELEDSYENSQVIITAHEGSGACPRKTPSSGCFSIEISASVEENIVSAKLWFLLKDSADEIYQNRTLVVSHISSGRHSRRSVLHTASVVYQTEWQNVDLTRAVRHMVVHERRTYVFEVRCTTCSGTGSPVGMKPGRRPFLVLGKGTRRPRAPRSIICPPNHTTCCKEIFYVSFAELKWDWIIEPKGYSANYCRGSCEDNVAQGYGHTYIMTTVKNLNVDRGLSIIPCCAPIKTKPLVLLYYDNEGYIYKKQLKNMITESCACM